MIKTYFLITTKINTLQYQQTKIEKPQEKSTPKTYFSHYKTEEPDARAELPDTCFFTAVKSIIRPPLLRTVK